MNRTGRERSSGWAVCLCLALLFVIVARDLSGAIAIVSGLGAIDRIRLIGFRPLNAPA